MSSSKGSSFDRILPDSPPFASRAPAIGPCPTAAGVHGGLSVFASIVQAPKDPVLGVTVADNQDPSPMNLNLSLRTYRTEINFPQTIMIQQEGKPLVLNVVRRAEQLLVNDTSRSKEYQPITGLADFNQLSAKLILGTDSPAIQEKRVATVQCLLGTGAEFLAKHYHWKAICIPQPTWGNHPKISTMAGLSVKTYRYYDPATRGLNFQAVVYVAVGRKPSILQLQPATE